MSKDDDATDRELFERKLIINAHKNRRKESPEFNKDGKRICIDCEVKIIAERVKYVDAVRCVTCQEIEDNFNKGYA